MQAAIKSTERDETREAPGIRMALPPVVLGPWLLCQPFVTFHNTINADIESKQLEMFKSLAILSNLILNQ